MNDSNTGLRKILQVATLLADSLEQSLRPEIWTGGEEPEFGRAVIRPGVTHPPAVEPVKPPLSDSGTLTPGPDLSEEVGWED